MRAASEQIVITSGTGHAVDVLARTIFLPGSTVAVEEPGYPPVTSLFRSLGFRTASVPVDSEGLVVDAIPSGFRMVYVTPSHQYLLGMVLSHRCRVALLAWARDHDGIIVEDDYDSEFRYGTRPLEPLQNMDRESRVIYVGSFSKSLSPALRIGFAVLPVDWVPAFTRAGKPVMASPPR